MQTVSQVAISNTKSESIREVAVLQTDLQKLQNEHETVKERTLSLQKINNNLENSLSKYALLLSEEKNERKELMEKYDHLQNKYHIEIQKAVKKYYLL